MNPISVLEAIDTLKFMIDDFECREINEKHNGDCTQEAHTCMKCLWQNYLEACKTILSFYKRYEQLKDKAKCKDCPLLEKL